MDGFKPKLRRNSWDGSLSSPQYQISYDKRGKPEHNLAISRSLRQKLLGSCSVVVELDSNLLAIPEPEREAAALAFRSGLETRGLEFRHRASPPTGRSSLVAKLLKSSGDAHQILVLVDPATLADLAFESLLPPLGVRYYCLPPADTGIGLLDDLFQGKLLHRHILERFDWIIFDVASMGQMGIISQRQTYETLQALLA